MAATASWQFILTDLMGVPLGELRGASDRTVTVPLSRLTTASFKIPMWHPLADSLVTQETLLQCWRTDVTNVRRLVFNGPIRGVNEVTDNTTQTVAATATGPYVKMGSRLLGMSKAGVKFPASGTRDLGLIAHDILDIVNGQEFTGISKGNHTASVSGATGQLFVKNAAEAISELASGLNSFEYAVRPVAPTIVGGLGGWPQIGMLDVAPFIGGTMRLDAIYEYGTPRSNVSGYERAISREGLATKAWISVSGWPDSTTQDLLSRVDTPAQTARGLYEVMVPDNGVLDDNLRQSILDYHVQARKQPRETVTFKIPSNARPSALTDFEVGDFIRARAVVRGSTRFDAMFRVWGVTFNIDLNGNESNELELLMP